MPLLQRERKDYSGVETTNLSTIIKPKYRTRPMVSKWHMLYIVFTAVLLLFFLFIALQSGSFGGFLVFIIISSLVIYSTVDLYRYSSKYAKEKAWDHPALRLTPLEHEKLSRMEDILNLVLVGNRFLRYSYFSINPQNPFWTNHIGSSIQAFVNGQTGQVLVTLRNSQQFPVQVYQPFVLKSDISSSIFVAYMVDSRGVVWKIEDPYKHLVDVHKVKEMVSRAEFV